MATRSKKLAQHPGTVSARVMARILGTTERRIGFAARRGWLPCKWTEGRRPKFDPDEVLEHLPTCPAVLKRIRPPPDFADMAEAALWADNALIVGLCSVPEPPSSIALAFYIWAKRDKEHQDLLTRFLFSCAFRRPMRSARPGDTSMYRLPAIDDFARVLALLKQYGLTGRPARQLAYKLSDCG